MRPGMLRLAIQLAVATQGISVIVLNAGTGRQPWLASVQAILRPPQAFLLDARLRSTSATVASAVRDGLACGRR